jgi:hypothetical protein
MLFSLASNSQSSWVTKELGNNIIISFPNLPTYKLVNKTGIYASKTANTLSFALVQYDVIPNYSEFLKLSSTEQDRLIEVFLDNALEGVLAQSGSGDASNFHIRLDKYKGRETSFHSINPATGELISKHCKILYAYNKLFMFQSMYLSESLQSQEE